MDTVAKYRKKPVVVEAVQWTGENEASLWMFIPQGRVTLSVTDRTLTIRTLEGEMIASVGDFIIKGVAGEFYPCKPDIFEATYDNEPFAPADGYEKRGYASLEEMGDEAERRLAQDQKDGSNAHIKLPGIEVRFQSGPIKDNGVNGCQMEDVIDVLVARIEGFQGGPFSCLANKLVIMNLSGAKGCLEARTADRVKRGVEGEDKP